MPDRPDRPRLDVSRAEGRTAVRLANCPRLSEEAALDLGWRLADLVEERPGEHLLVDLAEVEYLTSTALGELIALAKRLRAGGGRLSLINVHPLLFEALVAMRLDKLLDAHPAGQDPASGSGPATKG
jgi:anti-anti-sigma factor